MSKSKRVDLYGVWNGKSFSMDPQPFTSRREAERYVTKMYAHERLVQLAFVEESPITRAERRFQRAAERVADRSFGWVSPNDAERAFRDSYLALQLQRARAKGRKR